MAADLYARIEEALGYRATQARPLSGGCVGEVYAVRLESGDRVVVKYDQSATPCLDIEGFMLRYLAEHSALPVPGVRHAAPTLLIMDFVEGASHFSRAAEEDAAAQLAALHAHTAPQYGLARDTLIGGLHQPNTPADSWIDFFVEQRLLYMGGEALRAGAMPRAMYRRIKQFCDRIDTLIDEPEQPALLHGDVWTTNVIADSQRITGFIDPAVYYGHPEIELAFITLFNTFSPAFFEAYHQHAPIAEGFFEVRREIYNLYPLLVHTRLFGSSYLSGVERTLSRHGC